MGNAPSEGTTLTTVVPSPRKVTVKSRSSNDITGSQAWNENHASTTRTPVSSIPIDALKAYDNEDLSRSAPLASSEEIARRSPSSRTRFTALPPTPLTIKTSGSGEGIAPSVLPSPVPASPGYLNVPGGGPPSGRRPSFSGPVVATRSPKGPSSRSTTPNPDSARGFGPKGGERDLFAIALAQRRDDEHKDNKKKMGPRLASEVETITMDETQDQLTPLSSDVTASPRHLGNSGEGQTPPHSARAFVSDRPSSQSSGQYNQSPSQPHRPRSQSHGIEPNFSSFRTARENGRGVHRKHSPSSQQRRLRLHLQQEEKERSRDRDREDSRSPQYRNQTGNYSPAPSTSGRRSNSSSPAEDDTGAVGERNELTAEELEMVRREPEMWGDPAFFTKHLNETWEHYDDDGNGVFTAPEVRKMAHDAVDRYILAYAAYLRIDRPKLPDAQVERLLRADIPHLLPGDNVDDIVRNMVQEIFKRMGGGSQTYITRPQFVAHWPTVYSELFPPPEQLASKQSACIIS